MNNETKFNIQLSEKDQKIIDKTLQNLSNVEIAVNKFWKVNEMKMMTDIETSMKKFWRKLGNTIPMPTDEEIKAAYSSVEEYHLQGYNRYWEG